MENFHGWTAGALWEGLKFDIKHFKDIERIAMVGEKAWEKGMATFCKPFITAKSRYFDRAERAAAKDWITEDDLGEIEEQIALRTKVLQQALDEIKTLKGIIPICSYCHSIRNDEGAWDQLEVYLSKNTDAALSHGVCPKCVPKVRAEFGLVDEE
jgi:hypothetical protein